MAVVEADPQKKKKGPLGRLAKKMSFSTKKQKASASAPAPVAEPAAPPREADAEPDAAPAVEPPAAQLAPAAEEEAVALGAAVAQKAVSNAIHTVAAEQPVDLVGWQQKALAPSPKRAPLFWAAIIALLLVPLAWTVAAVVSGELGATTPPVPPPPPMPPARTKFLGIF
jgi:hypothetical protein